MTIAAQLTNKPNGNATAGRMALSTIHKGVSVGPMRVLLYGVEGIGKTTFAASAPKCVFLGAEDGFGLLDVARFPEPRTWLDVMEAIRVLETEPHEFQTLALDTIDWLEPLCWAQVCTDGGKATIEDFGYGKGYTAALEKWRLLLSGLERLRRNRKMNVVLLAHAKIHKFVNPEGDDFDRYTLKVHEKTAGLVKEWVDAVLFAQFRVVVDKAKGAAKGKGIGTPERVMYTVRRASFEAKNRYALPESLPLAWEGFAKLASNPRSAAELLADIRETAARVPEEVRVKAVAYAEANATDRNRLAEVLTRLRTIVETNETSNEKSE